MGQKATSFEKLRLLFSFFALVIGAAGRARAAEETELYAGDFVKGIYAEFPVVGGRPNLLRLSLANPHERPVDILVAVYFDSNDTLLYGRRIQIPPFRQTVAWLPVEFPDPKYIVDRGFQSHILVRSLGDSTGLIPNEFGALQLKRSLQVESQEPATGIIHSFSTPDSIESQFADEAINTLEFMRTARFARGMRQNWKTLIPGFASAEGFGVQSLDQLIVANNALLDDPEGLNAVRRWVHAGGVLWIMLDFADSQIPAIILGDRYRGQELERVELTSVQFVDNAGHVLTAAEHEVPVPMTRILIDGVDVFYTVDGWPAAFELDYGRGQVFVTTLGGSGWVRTRNPGDGATLAGEGWETKWVPLLPYDEFAGTFFARRDRPGSVRPVLTSYTEDYIGYRIPGRSTVVSVLGGYSLISILLAVYLWRKKRLPLFAAFGPLLAVAAAGTLIAARPSAGGIPSTAVMAELVTPIEGTDDTGIEGVAGIYTPDSTPLRLSGASGGWLIPDMNGFGGGIRTWIRTGLTSWEWDNLRASPGFRTANFADSGTYGRVEARATINEQGVTGRLELPESFTPEDAIVATTSGRIGVTFDDHARFTASAADTLGSDQYLGAELLGDEQRRHIAILKKALNDSSAVWRPSQPHLMFWTKPWDLGFAFGKDVRREGKALVTIPLRLERPPAGSRFLIPAPLIDFQERLGPDGFAPGGLYNYRDREWTEKTVESESWFAFQFPSELAPLDVTRGEVQVSVTGPVGRLELWGWNGKERVRLDSWQNPVGSRTIEITKPSALGLSDDGKLLLLIKAGLPSDSPEVPSADNATLPTWRIESLSLSIDAVIPPVPAD